jgi:serine/threonine protein kinase
MSRAEGTAPPIVTHQPSGKAVRASRGVTSTHEEPQVPLLLINRYRVTTMIGSGSFGHIFEADDIHTHEQVAVKFESHSLQYPQLAYEARVLKLIPGTGIPKVFWLVKQNELSFCYSLLLRYGEVDDYNVLVMEKLGPSIEDLLCYCRRSFSLKTVLLLAEQMLKR